MTTTYQEAQEDVNRPGKFERQEPWVVLAYEESLDGMWDYEDDDTLSRSDITDDLRAAWRLDPDTVRLTIYEDDQGFVSGWQS